MIFSTLLAFLIGTVTVLQSGMNRRVGLTEGLPGAVLLNSFVVLLIALVFFYAQKLEWIPFPSNFRSQEFFQFRKWWFWIPGIFGFVIVLGFPLAISYVGATRVFIMAVAGQCVAGILWDLWIEHSTPSLLKILGVLLTLLGAVLVNF